MRWWLRNLAVGAGVGFAAGLIVGGLLGRVFMRLLTLAQQDAIGFQTMMGAIIGEFTASGTFFIATFGAFVGVGLGIAYVVVRTLLPSSSWVREVVFVGGATALLLGQIVRANRGDFELVPVTLSVVLITGSVAITALPVPVLIERLAPDRERRPGRLSYGLVGLGLVAVVTYAVSGVVDAYTVTSIF